VSVLDLNFQPGVEPFETHEPSNRNIKLIQIRVENKSEQKLEHCVVRIEHIKPSNPDAICWIFSDSKLALPELEEEFLALNPHDWKDIPIAQLDALSSGFENLGIELRCYSVQKFPALDLEQQYILTIRSSAEIGEPIERKFRLWVDELKQLRLKEGESFSTV
jgi:hypothetical protein